MRKIANANRDPIVYSLTDLHENIGSVFDGNAISKINDTISVGLALEIFYIYFDGELIDTASPKEVLKKVKSYL